MEIVTIDIDTIYEQDLLFGRPGKRGWLWIRESSSQIISLPSRIGRLQNLRALDFECTTRLENLPEEIGHLINLEILKLKGSFDSDPLLTTTLTLPSSIGRLRNLRVLDLERTTRLENLPDEIGNLISLEQLNLSYTSINSLPSSIGRLQNLQYLHLKGAQLTNLPDEIGNLIGLKNLNLCGARINSLPSSIGRLQNLRHLDLSCTLWLRNLPDKIGNLIRLEELNLEFSGIASIPHSIIRLRNLRFLNLFRPNFLCRFNALARGDWTWVGNDIKNFIFWLVECCPFLGLVALGKDLLQGLTMEEKSRLHYSLANNRARFRRARFRRKTPIYQPKIWAYNMLLDAGNVFNLGSRPYYHRPDHHWANDMENIPIKTQEAFHQILLDGRELFVGLLLNR